MYTVLVADLASTLLAEMRVVERVYIHRLEASGRMPADKVLEVRASLHGALLVTSVDLPVARAVGNDTGTMHAFQLSQCPTALKVTSDVACVILSATRRVGMLPGNVERGRLHS